MSDPSQNPNKMDSKLNENPAADVAIEAVEAAKNACKILSNKLNWIFYHHGRLRLTNTVPVLLLTNRTPPSNLQLRDRPLKVSCQEELEVSCKSVFDGNAFCMISFSFFSVYFLLF
jgi:hypothetical protein